MGLSMTVTHKGIKVQDAYHYIHTAHVNRPLSQVVVCVLCHVNRDASRADRERESDESPMVDCLSMCNVSLTGDAYDSIVSLSDASDLDGVLYTALKTHKDYKDAEDC